MQNFGLAKFAAGSPRLLLGDPAANAQEIASAWYEADKQGSAIVVFPLFPLTGVTCGDLFLREDFTNCATQALSDLAKRSREFRCAALISLPFRMDGALYPIAVLLAQGRPLALFPLEPGGALVRSFSRWTGGTRTVNYLGFSILLGIRTLQLHGMTIGVVSHAGEILQCSHAGAEVVLLPMAQLARAGGLAIATQCTVFSAAGKCAVALACAGPGESGGEGVYTGECMICEQGMILKQSERFAFDGQMISVDIDIGALRYRRCSSADDVDSFGLESPRYAPHQQFDRPLSIHPFFEDVPATYEEAFRIQVAALRRRLLHIGTKKIVLAWSGGLDSTSALMVARQALIELNAPPVNLTAVSMPGLATSSRTLTNARTLAKEIGCDFREIDIRALTLDTLRLIGHDGETPDITMENAQARLRTNIVMNLANLIGALQLSTGDMSEIALGFCTYGGDQTGQYGVNAGIPKTMLQGIIRWHAMRTGNETMRSVLLDILKTPISPELKPGKTMQSTEVFLGPYALHDFFLYHHLCGGADRDKLRFFALRAFTGRFGVDDIDRALDIFLRRFYSSQFKRATAPEAPRVLELSLSSNGGMFFPSDMYR